jgi:hypothetical protein
MSAEPMWTTEAVHDRFLELETESGLFDLRVEGISVWERIRFDVNRKLMQEIGLIGSASDSGSSRVERPLKRLQSVGEAMTTNNPYLSGTADVLCWGLPRRKQQDDGNWWDLYFDPLYERLDFDYLHVEEPYLGTHRKPAKTDQLAYLDLISVADRITDTTQRPTIQFGSPVRRTLDGFEESLETVFDASIDVTRLLRRSLRSRSVRKPMYEKLLDRVDPSVCVLVRSYGKETFIEACRERDIPTVELQHGALSEYHFGYSFPSGRTKAAFPDYFFAFGDHFRTLVDYPIPPENVRSVGYPYLEATLEKFDSGTRSSTEQTPATDCVLFLSQGTVGEQLSKLAVAVSEHDEFDGEIVYKHHPREYESWTEHYPWLVDADISVVDSDSPSLYELFDTATVQVGVYSTTLYEGLVFGLQTFLLNMDRLEFVRDIVEAGWAGVVDSAGELVEQLMTPTRTTVDQTQLFEPEPWDSFERELKAIVDRTET